MSTQTLIWIVLNPATATAAAWAAACVTAITVMMASAQ